MKVITTYTERVELEGDPDGPPFLRRMADVFGKLADTVQPDEATVHVGVEMVLEGEGPDPSAKCDCSGYRGHGPDCATKKQQTVKVARVHVKVEREM